MLPGTSTQPSRLPMATPIRGAVPSSRKQRHVLLEDYKGVEKVIRSLVHLRDTYPRRKKIARELKYFRRNRHRMRYTALKEQGLPIGSGVTGGSVQDSSNATHEEVRNAMGRARRPSHSILPRSRAEQSLRASLDPARTYLQGGGYDSRQCRADTQLAMIGVSMRVTPNRLRPPPSVAIQRTPPLPSTMSLMRLSERLVFSVV